MFWAVLAAAMQMLAGGPETILLTWLFLAVLACADCLQGRGRAHLEAALAAEDRGSVSRSTDVNGFAPQGDLNSGEQLTRCGSQSRGLDGTLGGAVVGTRFQICFRFACMVGLVSLICAVQLLPFLQLAAHSQRDAGFGLWGWDMPFWGWANFLVPLFRTVPNAQGLCFQPDQCWTGSYYAGIGTVFLAAVAIRRVRDRRLVMLGLVVALGLALALGDRGLLYRAVRRCFPAIGLVRYPVKYVILILALSPLLAAFGLSALAGKIGRGAVERVPAGTQFRRFEWTCIAVIAGLIGLILLLDRLFPNADSPWGSTWKSGLSRAGLLGVVVCLLFALGKASGPKRTLFALLLLVAVWFDFGTHVPFQNPGVARTVYTPGWAAAQLSLKPAPQPGQFRAMMSPGALEAFEHHVLSSVEQTYLLDRLAMMGNCNLLDGTPVAYGFFSLLPLEANNANSMPLVYTSTNFSALLDLMAVAQCSSAESAMHWTARPSAMPMVTTGQLPVFADDDTLVKIFFANTNDFRKIVYLPPEARGLISAVAQPSAKILTENFESQRVTVQVETPSACLVLISQSWYPAWKAYVDGVPVKLWRADYAFQAVEVQAGRHTVRFAYEDRAFRVGGMLSCAGLVLWLRIGWQGRKR